MAALNDIGRLTERLVKTAQETHAEVEGGNFDLARLTQLADEVGGQADQLAQLFQQLDDVLGGRVQHPEADAEEMAEDLSPGQRAGGGNGSRPVDEATREELYERAKQMGVPGRSEMTKEQLAEAVRGGSPTATTTPQKEEA